MATIFEKIIAREIPADILHEDEHCIAIRDIDPQAPTHFLVIPKQVIPRIGEARQEDQTVIGHLLLLAGKIARAEGLEKDSVWLSTMALKGVKPFLIYTSMYWVAVK